MTEIYQDSEMLSRLLEEKEKDLELAAKIGQELLGRNKTLDERVILLESAVLNYKEEIIRIKHELSIKTELLSVYVEDEKLTEEKELSTLTSFHSETLRKKINDLEIENRKLRDETTVLSLAAKDIEEKEEKLISEAAKYLSKAKGEINLLSEEFIVQQDESFKQSEEITHLLAQVCNLQTKVKKITIENEDLNANLKIYRETQNDLTSELVEFKDKYREVVDLLQDAQNELRNFRKKGYLGMGSHTLEGMFPTSSSNTKELGDSLLDEIYDSLKNSRYSGSRSATSDYSEAEVEYLSQIGHVNNGEFMSGGSSYHRTFSTFKYVTSQLSKPLNSSLPENSLRSYTISRDNSYSNLFHPEELSPQSRTSSISSFLPPLSHREIVDFEISEKEDESQEILIQTIGQLSAPISRGKEQIPRLTRPFGSLPGEKASTFGNLVLGSVPNQSLISPETKEVSLSDSQDKEITLPINSETFECLETSPFVYVPTISSLSCSFKNKEKQNNETEKQTQNSSCSSREIRVGSLGSLPLGKIPFHNSEFESIEKENVELLSASTLTLHKSMIDSGVLSGDYSDIRGGVPDGMSDSETDCYETYSYFNTDLAARLRNLNPEEIHRMRRQNDFRDDDLTSDASSPPYRCRNLPYGIKTPNKSFDSTENFVSQIGGWKLPDKLRIVKPIEGSLTLHNWSRLAEPSLDGFLTEMSGVAFKGKSVTQDISQKIPETLTRSTLTNSTVLHPESTRLTSTYSSYQICSGFEGDSRRSSRLSSRMSSVSDLRTTGYTSTTGLGTSTYSTNVGLACLLKERNIYGECRRDSERRSSLYFDEYENEYSESEFSFRTKSPSLFSSRPSTPPMYTPPNSPKGHGIVQSFFESLKASFYGPEKKNRGRRDFGILATVEKVGVDKYLSPSSALIDDHEIEDDFEFPDYDELEDILPGSLTLTEKTMTNSSSSFSPPRKTSDLMGQLTTPSLAPFRPFLRNLGNVPQNLHFDKRGGGGERPILGIPGTPGTHAIDRLRPDLGIVPPVSSSSSSGFDFIGTITSTFFGRKGGLL